MDNSSDYELKNWMYCENEAKFCQFCQSELVRLDEITYECQNGCVLREEEEKGE